MGTKSDNICRRDQPIIKLLTFSDGLTMDLEPATLSLSETKICNRQLMLKIRYSVKKN